MKTNYEVINLAAAAQGFAFDVEDYALKGDIGHAVAALDDLEKRVTELRKMLDAIEEEMQNADTQE